MADILEELFKKKTDDGKKPLQVEGLSFIHPMHEAAIAFFRKNLTDGAICQIFAKDENSLRKAISIEVLADNLEPQKRDPILRRITPGANMTEIVDILALSYAESRRVYNGNILKEMSIPSDSNGKYLLEAIRQEKVSPIYLEAKKIESLESKAKSIKRKKIAKNIFKYTAITTIAALTSLFVYSASEIMKEDETKIKELKNELNVYSSFVEQLPYAEKESFRSLYDKEKYSFKK